MKTIIITERVKYFYATMKKDRRWANDPLESRLLQHQDRERESKMTEPEIQRLQHVAGDLANANRKKHNRIEHQKQEIKRLQAALITLKCSIESSETALKDWCQMVEHMGQSLWGDQWMEKMLEVCDKIKQNKPLVPK